MSSAVAASAYLAALICSGATPAARASASNCTIDWATWSINCPDPARDSEARKRPSSNSKEAEARDSGLPGIATRSTETCGEIGAGVIGAGALACCM